MNQQQASPFTIGVKVALIKTYRHLDYPVIAPRYVKECYDNGHFFLSTEAGARMWLSDPWPTSIGRWLAHPVKKGDGREHIELWSDEHELQYAVQRDRIERLKRIQKIINAIGKLSKDKPEQDPLLASLESLLLAASLMEREFDPTTQIQE